MVSFGNLSMLNYLHMHYNKGYDWYEKTKKALSNTESFFKDNIATINVITKAFTSRK